MIVLNSKGKRIRLDTREAAVAKWCQRKINANPTGFQVSITTLTEVIKQVQEQKFFTVNIADYVPIRTGFGAWAYDLLTFQEYATGGDFETGIIDTGGDNSRLASVDAGVSPIRVPIKNWAKQLSWSLPELNYANKFGNWDLITAKEKSRKKNWDLGIQRVAFLGLPSMGMAGLLTLPTSGSNSVIYDSATLTTRLMAMDAATFSAFVSTLLGEWRTGNAHTAWPNRFVVPEFDYVGLSAPTNPAYPLITKKAMLERSFKDITGEDFKILPLAYAQASLSNGQLAADRYALYRYADDTIRMDIPVQYTPTVQSSVNGFHFQNVGYGQFTGVGLYRPTEVMYIDFEGSPQS